MKRFITTALMLTCLVACTFAQSIVGTWKATPETFKNIAEEELGEGVQPDVQFTFNAGETFNILADIPVGEKKDATSDGPVIRISVSGKYSIQNNTPSLQMKSKKVTADIIFPGLDKKQSDLLKKMIMHEKKNVLGKNFRFDDELIYKYSIHDDTLTLETEDEKLLPLKKVK